MKKARLLIISLVLLAVAFIVFTFIIPANKNNKENKEISFVSPTPSPLDEIKKQLTTNFKVDDFLNIEYREKSDSFIVFYQGDKAQAGQKIIALFQKFNISSSEIKGLKIEYISTDRGKDEPLPGYGQY